MLLVLAVGGDIHVTGAGMLIEKVELRPEREETWSELKPYFIPPKILWSDTKKRYRINVVIECSLFSFLLVHFFLCTQP